MPTTNYGSGRWIRDGELESEGLLYYQPFDHDPRNFKTLKNKIAYLNENDAYRYAFILGQLVDPKKMTRSILDTVGDQPTSSFWDSLTSLFQAKSQGKGQDELGWLMWPGDGHLLTVAPTRSGKGVGVVIPNLLHYPGSAIVMDPKGESYAITHRYREETFHQKIVCLDPFNIRTKHTDSINPFDGIIPDIQQNPELGDEVSMITDALVMSTPNEKDPHWNDKCRSVLKGLILAVLVGMGPNQRCHLSEVRALLTGGKNVINACLAKMQLRHTPAGDLLKRASFEIQTMGDREFMSVISKALLHTEFLDSPLIEKSLGRERDGGRGTYDLRELKSKGGVTIYMIMPPYCMSRYIRVIRLWIVMAMTAMARTDGKPADGCNVLFMLDEMAQLGTMDMMRQAVSLMAGYGMTIWMIWQDLSQLKKLYEHDWPSFLANAKIQQFFGINDLETAKHISEMLGSGTVEIRTESAGKNTTGFTDFTNSTNKGFNWSEIGRNLLNPDEVRRLNCKAVILFVQGLSPIMTERITYHTDRNFEPRADPNPLHAK